MKYYVVWNGLETGVFTTWEECSRQIKGVQGALYKSFKTMEEAEKTADDIIEVIKSFG